MGFLDFFLVGLGTILAVIMVICVTLILKQRLSKSRFLRFIGIFIILFISSGIPLLWLGMLFGFPSVVLGSLLVSIFLDKEE